MNRWLTVTLLSIIAAFIHQLVYDSEIGERLEPQAMDLWYYLRGAIDPPEDIVLIAIDEESYEVLGAQMDKAWPRILHARLLERLASVGVKRVVFDVIFGDPSDDAEADRRLAHALSLLDTTIGAEVTMRPGAGYKNVYKLLGVFEPFQKSAARVALVGKEVDFDVLRRFKVVEHGPAKLAGLLTLAEAGAGIDIKKDERPSNRDFIWYYGPAGTIPTFSFHEILDQEWMPDDALKEELGGKVVFVGLLLRTGLGPEQKDSFLTPMGRRNTFGVEIHATAAGNLKNGTWIHRESEGTEKLLLTIATFVTSLVLFSLRPGWAGLALTGFILGWSSLAYHCFQNLELFIPGVALCMVMILSYFFSTIYYYLLTFRSQKRTQRAFEMYLTPQMAREVGRDPSRLELGGESVYGTALFTDIASFTTISEKMRAEEVSRMLNDYFTEVMEVVFENEGTMIKFIGDAAFAIWGAPIKMPDHGQRAVQTAIIIEEKVDEFNRSERYPALHTRIGVHTGPMVVGNLGSARRFDYTAIGDTVNLAARLEGLNKYFGTSILFSETSRAEIKDGWSTLKIGTVAVAGKRDAVDIHTAFLNSANYGKLIAEHVEKEWLKALRDFQRQHWKEAREGFSHVLLSEERLKKACELYLEQIESFTREPPGDEWSGEIQFDTK